MKRLVHIMDPEGEQENLDSELEEINLHPDFIHLDPQEFLDIEKTPNREKSYRPIEVEKIELLNQKSRNLDFYQRKVIECAIQYTRKVVKALGSIVRDS